MMTTMPMVMKTTMMLVVTIANASSEQHVPSTVLGSMPHLIPHDRFLICDLI